jgi:hypothetical protein
MQELFPLTVGMIIGALIQKIRRPNLRILALVILCIAFGLVASFINGELSLSWSFLTFDAALVWVGAAVSIGLSAGWRRCYRHESTD